MVGAGGMVKCSLCEHEDLSLDHQHSQVAWWSVAVTPVRGRQRQEDP